MAWPSRGERFWERSPRVEPFPLQLQDSAFVPPQRDGQALHVVHIAAELAPIGKVRKVVCVCVCLRVFDLLAPV